MRDFVNVIETLKLSAGSARVRAERTLDSERQCREADAAAECDRAAAVLAAIDVDALWRDAKKLRQFVVAKDDEPSGLCVGDVLVVADRIDAIARAAQGEVPGG